MSEWHGVVLSTDGKASGCCVLLENDVLLTAGHVIRTALKTDEYWRDFWKVAKDKQITLAVSFPNADPGTNRKYSAVLLGAPWLTDDPDLQDGTDGGEPNSYDFCFLKLSCEGPQATPAQLKTPFNLERNPVNGEARVPVVQGPHLDVGHSPTRLLNARSHVAVRSITVGG